jgi:hypothetical protein
MVQMTLLRKTHPRNEKRLLYTVQSALEQGRLRNYENYRTSSQLGYGVDGIQFAATVGQRCHHFAHRRQQPFG